MLLLWGLLWEMAVVVAVRIVTMPVITVAITVLVVGIWCSSGDRVARGGNGDNHDGGSEMGC